MESRAKILSRIRTNKVSAKSTDKNILAARIADHKRNLVPKRGQIPLNEQIDLFQQKMELAQATVERVKDEADIPAQIQKYLANNNLPTRIKASPSPEVSGLAWSDIPTLEIVTGAAEEQDMVGLSPAFAGVSETGTLMMVSGADTPSTINFLPENHIVILKTDRMKGSYEEAWDAVREVFGTAEMPRTVNLISGPSRTADIEQRLIMGAHGPKQLHIILVGDDG
jgi:L-lactate dehydrogenase complex protein LldG